MMFYDFKTKTHGKWILAGEHAVLRGHGALVFPLKTQQFSLCYTAKSSELNIEISGENTHELPELVLQALHYGQQLLGNTNKLTGQFLLNSTLPIGRGLGASAALCLALARWFSAQNLIESSMILSFAKSLEDLFHGKSSGLDIIGASAAKGLYFKQGQTQELNLSWQPKWFLSFCGEHGSTADCIAKVKKLWQESLPDAKLIDLKMNAAVESIRLALENPNSLKTLQKSITEASECFRDWGLITPKLEKHMEELKRAGALAVKPTGSGGGGYLLSLWDFDTTVSDPSFIPLLNF